MNRRLFLTLSAALLSAGPASSPYAGTLTEGVLEVRSDAQNHQFNIEIADDASERARGLMFRESLADDAGMLFIYPRERNASFWMKNTYIPLDMLFIANDGTILQIVSQVQPHSLTPVRSDAPVRAVLEIAGGQAEALGIAVGDTVVLYR